jgi:hypothetical protein
MPKKKAPEKPKLSRDEFIKKFSLAEYIGTIDEQDHLRGWFRVMHRQGYDLVAYGTGEWVEESYLVKYIWVFYGDSPKIRVFPRNALRLMNKKIVESREVLDKKFYSLEDFEKYLEENKITLSDTVEL